MTTKHSFDVQLIDAFIRHQRFRNNWKNTADEAAMRPASIVVFSMCLIWMAAAFRIDSEWALWICGRPGAWRFAKAAASDRGEWRYDCRIFLPSSDVSAYETLKNSKTLNPGRD